MPCAKKVHCTDLFGLILKDADELLADDLALALGGVLTGQLLVEAVTGIDADKVYVELAALAKDLADLLALILAQQTVVHEHAGQLLADGLGQHGRADAGIHAAGQGAEYLAVADLFAQVANMHHHRIVGAGHKVLVPHRAEQVLHGHHAAAMLDQIQQD